jgi:glycosyltransferase involved in cell wall biosynthesis
LKLGFVSGLSDKKVFQKLAPLQSLPEVSEIHIYRRQQLSGNKIFCISMPKFFRSFAPFGDLWRFVKLLINVKQYDLTIACHQRYHGVYAALAGFLFKKKVIQLIITDPDLILRGFLGKWALNKACAIGFRGTKSLNRYRDKYGSNKPLFILHNAWSFNNSIIMNAEKSIDLFYVGNFSADKDINSWFRAAADVKRKRGHIKAVLAGANPEKQHLKLIEDLGLKNDLEFTGILHGKALYKQYAKARVFLLTSIAEGLPMVLPEAMIAGLPVVTTNVGDISDIVTDGENGFLTQVGEIDALSNAVVKLLNDDNIYEIMSNNAFKSATEFLEQSKLEKVTKEWRRIFSELSLI